MAEEYAKAGEIDFPEWAKPSWLPKGGESPVEGAVNPKGPEPEAVFTIIAPSFAREENGEGPVSLQGVLVAKYLADLGKKTYLLDVSVPYGELNGWPAEILRKEGRRKSGYLKNLTRIFGNEAEIVPLEDLLDWRKVAPEEREAVPGEIEGARKVSYSPAGERELGERARRYSALRKEEYGLVTRELGAATVKESVPAEDALFDIRSDGILVPRIYLARPMGGKFFRPKWNELTNAETPESLLSKLYLGINAQILKGASDAFGLAYPQATYSGKGSGLFGERERQVDPEAFYSLAGNYARIASAMGGFGKR